MKDPAMQRVEALLQRWGQREQEREQLTQVERRTFEFAVGLFKRLKEEKQT